jgi:hypothetical protein
MPNPAPPLHGLDPATHVFLRSDIEDVEARARGSVDQVRSIRLWYWTSVVSRIERRFAQLRAESRAGLVIYLTAGDPDPDTSLALFQGLAGAGADLMEIGMPFSDPMADGPAIQAAGQRALKRGASLRGTLAMVRAMRERDPDTPYVC